jgi:RNA polymerase sigma-70 factor (ECF subfamily)
MNPTLKLAALDPAGLLGLLSRPMAPPSEEHGDGALVGRALDGDRGAARALFLRHRQGVGSLTLRLLRHRADAEEAAQEAFARAFDRLHQLHEPSEFGRWVRSIAINECRRLRRAAWWRRIGARLGVASEPGEALTLDAMAAPSCGPEVREALATVERVLRGVPEAHRDAWTLNVVEGLPLAETAEACGCSLATVKRWIAAVDAAIAPVAKRFSEEP